MTAEPLSALALVREGWRLLQTQRPLAAWASWQQALRVDPEDAAAREALDLLASADDLPAAARAVYRFRSPVPDRRAAWDAAFQGREMSDLVVAAAVFDELAEGSGDSAARYNQGLCRAWMGENGPAIDALAASVALDAAERFDDAVSAWTLAEVLRLGAGAEDRADDLSHLLVVAWPEGLGDPADWLSTFATLRPLPLLEGQGAQAFEWLDRPMPAASSALSADDLPRVRASLVASVDSLRLSSPSLESIATIDREIEDGFGDQNPRFERRSTPLPIRLADANVWRVRLPEGLDDEARSRLVREAVERYFEGEWLLLRRHGLEVDGGPSSPKEVASRIADESLPTNVRAIARARLTAVVRFREQLSARPRVASLYAGYPFDRLRRRLGLEPDDPNTVDPDDVSSMCERELAALDPATLDRPRLVDAHRSATLLESLATAERLANFLDRGDRQAREIEPLR